MKRLSKRQMKKFEYFGGYEKFKGLYESLYVSETTTIESDNHYAERFSNITIEGTSLALTNRIIPFEGSEDYDFIDLWIDKQRFTFMITKNEFHKLSKEARTQYVRQCRRDMSDLRVCKNRNIFVEIKNGFCLNVRVCDQKKYKSAEKALTKSGWKCDLFDLIPLNCEEGKIITYVPKLKADKINLPINKLEYFGGYEKLIGLYKSYRKFMKDKLCMFNTEKNNCGQLTDVTIDGTSLAVIITATMSNDLCYVDVIINEERYLLKLSNEELESALTGLVEPIGDFDEALKLIYGQPYFMSVENGYAKDLRLIDYEIYKEALELIPEFIQNIKEEQ